MVEFDATFVIQIINFLILLAVLKSLFFQPLLQVIQDRQSSLEKSEQEIQAKVNEIEQLQADLHRQLEAAQQTAHAIVSEQMKQSEEERLKLLKELGQELEDKLLEAQAKMAIESQKTKETLQKEVAPMARLILEQLIGEGAKVKGAR